ncbi:hypothetical protein ABCR94_17685 [Streptomyces sp. 21So2-11]|uniref:hypothetical protein n=1 Tax=Streptomyces sp. 21So2-11 TaxID=3144408 RepID=UPI00321C29AC
MTKTTHPTHRTLHAVPEPGTPTEPLTGLTGAPAALFTQLAALTAPATTAELALAAGIGRSTAGKALVTLEEQRLVVRIPGGHDGPRRTPDRWQPTPAPASATDTADPGTADTATPASSTPDHGTGNAPDTDEKRAETSPDTDSGATAITAQETPPTPVTPTPPAQEQAIAPVETPAPAGTTTPSNTPAYDDDTGEAPPAAHPGPAAAEAQTDTSDTTDSTPPAAPTPNAADTATGKNTSTPAPATPAAPVPVPTATATGSKRLAPGGLRQMVIDHLTAHPTEAFTATGISRMIDRSSGAIANALATLTQQGLAEQVTDRPRTYRRAGTVTA